MGLGSGRSARGPWTPPRCVDTLPRVALTVLQKSDLRRRPKKPKVALVLAGGAISGGAFKLGGLCALNAYLENRKVTELDIYLGISAGAFLAAPLSAGIPPEELLRSIHGDSAIITQFRPSHFYSPNWAEFLGRPAALVRDAVRLPPAVLRALRRTMSDETGRRHLRALFRSPSVPAAERLMSPVIREVLGSDEVKAGSLSYLPAGVFHNGEIEAFIRTNLRRNRVPNNFRLLHLERGNSLYICATNLNTAQLVMFGHDEDTSATISEAVQASSAIPGWFRPARIGNAEYVDGGVQRTANLGWAAQKGADLIIAYNPFRPFTNAADGHSPVGHRSMARMGPAVVMNQVFRSLLHSRLQIGMERLALDPAFKGDLLLIEPEENDARMFNISPIAFWKRALAAEAGYLSVKATLERHHNRISHIFDAYGLKTDLKRLKDDESALRVARESDDAVFDVLETEDDPPPQSRLYVVQ